MSIIVQALQQLAHRLPEDRHARMVTSAELHEARGVFGERVPEWFWTFMLTTKMAERVLRVRALDEQHDIDWFSPAQMAMEATKAIPGVSVLPIGYIPIGGCVSGSGNPYFVRFEQSDTSPVVQIYHDVTGKYLITDNELREGAYVNIADSISNLLQKSMVR